MTPLPRYHNFKFIRPGHNRPFAYANFPGFEKRTGMKPVNNIHILVLEITGLA